MLKGIDRTLAVLVWLVAAVLVVMLFAGPAVVAKDEVIGTAPPAYGSKPAAPAPSPAASAAGKQVFVGNCGRCHTLSAAGTNGQVGPNLDSVSLSASDIESIVRSGRGVMPPFAGQLSDPDISAVAAFVAASH